MPGDSRVPPARQGDLLLVWILSEMIADDVREQRDDGDEPATPTPGPARPPRSQ